MGKGEQSMRIIYAITEWLGYLFCEFSFRWADYSDGIWKRTDILDETTWSLHHYIVWVVFNIPNTLGNYFYGIKPITKKGD